MTTAESVKSEILLLVLRVLVIVCSVAYIPSLFACIRASLWMLALINTVAYIGVLYTAFSPRLRFTTRMIAFISISLVVGAAVLFFTGGEGAGYIWLIFSIMLSALYGEMKAVIATTGTATAIIVGYAILSTLGFATQPQDTITIGVISVNLLAVSISLSLMVRAILSRLEKANAELIEHRSKLEAANAGLREHRSQLEHEVTERTSQLAAARDEAERANRAKSVFLSTMSHEIRTPINAVIGFAGLLGSTALSPQQAEMLDKLQDASTRLLDLVNDILDLSKIEAEKLQIEHTDFDLQRELGRIQSLFTEMATSRGLAFDMDMDGIPRFVTGDRVRLGQILINFLGNAFKFTPQGRVSLHAEVIQPCPEGMILRFEVSDTGIGIDKESMSRLFTAFEQVETSTAQRFGGTGLGLAISKRLAGLLGGTIGVRSQPGSGSTFWVELPFGIPSEEIQTLQVESSPSGAPSGDVSPDGAGHRQPSLPSPDPVPGLHTESLPPRERLKAALSSRRGARILLAEDDAINQLIFGELLTHVGIELTIAENGAQALELLRSSRFDLVLMDGTMPVMDGFQATEEIRRLPDGGQLPVIALTASAFDTDLEKAKSSGMNEYLVKPIDPDDLYLCILKWLQVVSV